MCGIIGICDFRDKAIEPSLIQRMTNVVSHRGPDGDGKWIENSIGLGHRRLAIIDLTRAADQPMFSPDKRHVIVYNGEVYNFRELRLELEGKGHCFKSASDTEVVLASYMEWGEKCLNKFNGMFAFAIWDRKIRSLFIARDRYGIKPLYYFFKDNAFIFASEIKSILEHPLVNVKVCVEALNEYFSFQNVFSDHTLFRDIRILMPGHYARIKYGDSGISPVKYWDYKFEEDTTLGDAVECEQELLRLFERAVRRQMVSDVEIGAYLSGGMDSGAITSVAAKERPNLKSFTAGFEMSAASGLELGFDERGKAEYLSNQYKTEHYQVVLKAGDMERVMKNLVWHLEDLRVGQCYPNYYVSRLAGKFVKVCLSGAGSDELFAGYPWRYYRAVVNDDFDHYTDKYYKYWQRLIPDSYKPKFYQPSIYPQIWDYQTKDVFKTVFNGQAGPCGSPEEYINNSLYFEIKTFLHGLFVVEDKLSMAHGLETRVPFMDNDLVEFAMKIPVKLKLQKINEIVRINENEPGSKFQKYFEKTNDGKIILRKALNNFVPEHYTNGVKQGFSAPDSSWFKGESIDYVRDLLFNNNALIYEYIQPEFAQNLVNEHLEGKVNRRLLIWSLLCFEWWLKIFLKETSKT